LALLALDIVAPAGSWATSASDWGPGFKACGSFHAEYKINVFAKDVSCAKARRIQKDYWLGPPSGHVEVYRRHGPQIVLLKRFPGWRCFSGAGGGTCTKGRKVAAYSDI
jgi:hypothetical protein